MLDAIGRQSMALTDKAATFDFSNFSQLVSGYILGSFSHVAHAPLPAQ